MIVMAPQRMASAFFFFTTWFVSPPRLQPVACLQIRLIVPIMCVRGLLGAALRWGPRGFTNSGNISKQEQFNPIIQTTRIDMKAEVTSKQTRR